MTAPEQRFDLVIRGGRVVTPSGVQNMDIGVRGAHIVALGSLDPRAADRVIEAAGLVVLPGLIDTHVHLREPGYGHKETFGAGTRAAASSGITTVLDMPCDIPPTSSAQTLAAKDRLIAPSAYVDYALYGCAGAGNLDRIAELAENGVVGYKTFMEPAFDDLPGSIDMCAPDDAALFQVLRAVAATGLPSVIHAENDSVCALLGEELRRAGRNDPLAHALSRPPFAEEEAVQRALLLGRATGARVSFAHVSTAGAVARIRAAKAEGQQVTAEACPHHLLLTEDDLARVGPYGKINPPLRTAWHQAALWEGLLDGTIDFVGTDHSPYLVSEKDPGWTRIWDAPSGACGLDAAGRVMLTAVNQGRLTLVELAEVMSRRAAKTFGLYPRKGEIRVGADADLVLVDLTRRSVIDHADFQSAGRDAALLWDGFEATGAPVKTFVRGTEVFDGTSIVGTPGHGIRIRPLGDEAKIGDHVTELFTERAGIHGS
ncbi:allantoinase AllB [Microbacterium capsulatum]|uniref:allantoinase n=1 Tax=Microbacterium capsulatum TaxID=3041921 RepID=A0ABU0XBR4_9MICO|nr:allantoinase AllB [Microbacterium sp. ASV81]MDQ4212551.1 allantoinase AllB [Microbacterium sp. ASV81]